MVQLVGILNITPDSFSDGGKYAGTQAALAHAAQLFADGAAIVDVGAESTRPGAMPLTATQEWQRLRPILPELLRRYPGRISLDTYHPETAEKALQLGDVIINDISGMKNPALLAVIARHAARCIVSQLPASDAQTAHKQAPLTQLTQVRADLLATRDRLIAAGVPAHHIILDPGIGFGKTRELNRTLLSFAHEVPGIPVMTGYSRKRFLGDDRMELAPNLAAGTIAAQAGAAYLRVHDVAGHAKLTQLAS